MNEDVELRKHCEAAQASLGNADGNRSLLSHGTEALKAIDYIIKIVAVGEDPAIGDLLRDTREELVDAYVAAASGRPKGAWMLLRGVMEGLFASLFLRQQSLSLHLWASGTSYEMLHQMLAGDHDFRLYYKSLFEDERFKREFPGVSQKQVFEEANAVYEALSCYVHKNSSAVRTKAGIQFEPMVERIFRVFLSFLERENDLGKLTFPVPYSYCHQKKNARKETGENRDAGATTQQ